MVNQRELTEDGLEKNFATNTLGMYAGRVTGPVVAIAMSSVYEWVCGVYSILHRDVSTYNRATPHLREKPRSQSGESLTGSTHSRVALTCRWLTHPQVTVSSGGMYLMNLDSEDFQFERCTFDGSMAYAQNKVHVCVCVCALSNHVERKWVAHWQVLKLRDPLLTKLKVALFG